MINNSNHCDIAARSFEIFVGKQGKKPSSISSITADLITKLYRFLLMFVYIATAILVLCIPVIGHPLGILLLSCMGSFYCFEHQWINKGWKLSQSIQYFESHWSYFLGFGMPMTILSLLFPLLVKYGLFAFVFPLV